ncbi:hypothetical protein BKA58DRAFT_49006 [Alternaria rosae]|uniref:uncharacterized protein n=1 Tax=Alternaria rosae TaxID=1187941 RepID=UPI001E8DC542|nr:uncharacterized protein BKA58DRAFT_49006 [Alternaria rosae]KAH6858825.1 hypothetical protein BKA58DRAFT_49006 [Alternaria rosae]
MMLAGSSRFLPSSRSFATGRTLRVLIAFVGIAIGINLLVLFDWTYVESLPSDILGKQAFHPKPFAPLPHEHNAQADNGLDFWTWNTTTQFRRKEDIDWRDGVTDECALFPVHLLSKVQVILKTGSADDKSRTDAQLSTVIKCISNVLIVSDGSHTYGRDHRTIDVLADLPPNTYLKEEDYIVYEAQKNASRHGTHLQQGHEGWRIDKYKFLPEVEKAIDHNNAAEWYVFLESDTYIFWDNVFRLLENYNSSLPYYFGSPSPGRTYHPDAQSEVENQVWFAYGGAGFILSKAAAHRLVDRHRNALGLKGPRLTTEYKEDIRADCCGDSILGWALHDKAGIDISGLWPMFSPHKLENIPFGKDYWCEPVISLHKTDPALYKELWSWENEWRAKFEDPMRYRNLLYRALLFSLQGEYPQRENWDAAFDAGFQLPDSSTVHTNLDACRVGCSEHDECIQYTWHGRHCYYAKALYIGHAKQPDGHHDPEYRTYVSGWDLTKLNALDFGNTCAEGAHWVKPSIERKY